MKGRKILCAICAALLLLALCPALSHDTATTEIYTQYASGGTPTELEAVILFENKNSTFTRYQVAFTSCTCRGPESNYRSVMYIELLNNKDSAEEAKIRSISFGQLNGVTVGMWGDSNPVYMRPDYTAEYMDENFVQKLVGSCKADFDAWEGYGDIPDAVDADAVTGATVSVSNVSSVIQALFQYHADKYYS